MSQDSSNTNDKNDKNEEKGNDWFAEEMGTMEKYDELSNNPKLNPTALLRKEIFLEILEQIELGSKDSNCKPFENANKLRVWDFGAGSGSFSKIFVSLDNIQTLIASDLSKTANKYLEKMLGESIKSGKLLIVNNTDKDLCNNFKNDKDGTMIKNDIIFMSFTLHHLIGDSRNKLLQSVKNNLNSNGKFIVFEFTPQRAKMMFEFMSKAVDDIKDSEKKGDQKGDHKHGHDHGHKHGHKHGHDEEHGHNDEHGGHDHKHDHDFKNMQDTIKDLETQGFKAVCSIDFNQVLKNKGEWQKKLEEHKQDLFGYYAVVFEAA